MNQTREFLAGLHLLDHQIVDCDGLMAGNVDDLELDTGNDPLADLPVVTALLSGAGAMSRRIGGRLGRWIASIDRRLAAESTPARIPLAEVAEISSRVTVTGSRDQLETNRGEAWTRKHIIDHLPGAHRAAD